MIHGLMLAAAIEAAEPTESGEPKDAPQEAAQTPRDSFGRAGSVVLGDIVAARALTANAAPIGVIGAAPAALSAGWLTFSSTSGDGYRMRGVGAEPSFDVFVSKNFSLGGLVGFGVTKLEGQEPVAQELTLWHATVMPRVGAAFELTDGIAIWTRVAAGVTLFDWAAQDDVGKVFRVTADVPFVFRLTRHVALQTGPQVSYFNHVGGPSSWHGFSGGVSGGFSITL